MLDRKEHEGCVLSANQSVAGDGARPIMRRRYAPLITIGATPGSHKPGDNNCSSRGWSNIVFASYHIRNSGYIGLSLLIA